jgi:hypothetical protein
MSLIRVDMSIHFSKFRQAVSDAYGMSEPSMQFTGRTEDGDDIVVTLDLIPDSIREVDE